MKKTTKTTKAVKAVIITPRSEGGYKTLERTALLLKALYLKKNFGATILFAEAKKLCGCNISTAALAAWETTLHRHGVELKFRTRKVCGGGKGLFFLLKENDLSRAIACLQRQVRVPLTGAIRFLRKTEAEISIKRPVKAYMAAATVATATKAVTKTKTVIKGAKAKDKAKGKATK